MRARKFRFVWLLLITAGCVRSTYLSKTPPLDPHTLPSTPTGIYHRVEKGETLFRIADGYSTTARMIEEANRLEDPSVIEVGQLLYIPGARAKKETT